MCLYRIGPHQREGKASVYPVSLISFQPLEAKSAQACFMQHFTAEKTVRSNCLHCYHRATEPWQQPLEQVAVTLKAVCITKEYLSCTKIQPTKHVGDQSCVHPHFYAVTLLICAWPTFIYFSHTPWSSQFQLHLSCHTLVLSASLIPHFNQWCARASSHWLKKANCT